MTSSHRSALTPPRGHRADSPSKAVPTTKLIDPGYPESALGTLLRDVLMHRSSWAQGDANTVGFNPGYAEQVVKDAVEESGNKVGFQTPSGMQLWPFTRWMYFAYMLDAKIFSKNPDWDAWIFLDVSGAASRTLCVGWTGPPMSASEYSGWNYDICAAVIENLGNSPTAPYTGEPEYTGYWQFVQQNVLQPLGMLASSPGGTRRDSFYHNESSISNEATYPATTYLEQTGVPVASSPFEQTILYTLADEIEPDDLWYYDLAVPLDVITPAYVTRPYGGGVSLRHEAVVPAGGWVSTAPDLARLPLALVAGSSPLSNPALAATVAPGENYSPACFLSYTPLGQNVRWMGGDLNHAACYTSIEMTNQRRFSAIHVWNKLGGYPWPYKETITDFLFLSGL